MMRTLYWCLLALLGLGMAACSAEPAPTATPTATSTNTPIPTVTLPPTWTPGELPTVGVGGAEDATATRPPENTSVPGAPTLPPTWTPNIPPTVTRPAFLSPTPRPTITPAARNTQDASLLRPTIGGGPPTIDPLATANPACVGFTRAEPTDSIIFTNNSAQISWTPVEGATGYRIWLISPAARYTFDEVTPATSITIPADAFPGIGPYGWEVMPLLGDERFCPSTTGVITVRLAI